MRHFARRFLLLLLLPCPPILHANGVTIEPGSSTGSSTGGTGPATPVAGDGASGGHRQNPFGPSYVPDTLQLSNGSSSATTIAADPVNMLTDPDNTPVRHGWTAACCRIVHRWKSSQATSAAPKAR